MDRPLVYPGSIPLDTDLLSTNRNVMIALGYLAQAVLGTAPVIDGLACTPTAPASLSVNVGPGSITQFAAVDALAYGSLAADTADPLVKMGINLAGTTFTLSAPTVSGTAINYLLQATLQESDAVPIVLPYYNSSNPAQPYSGPNNAGTAQNTSRLQRVQLQLKPGAAAASGSQVTPPVDSGWSGLCVVTVSYGQTAITALNITPLAAAPLIPFKLPALRPGFGSSVQSFSASGSFTVPPQVTSVEVEVWGGGSGSFASIGTTPSGGGSGGGYARKRVASLTPGQVIPIVVGAGGAAGTTAGAPAGAGGTSSFGTYVSATGGSLNPSASVPAPQNGATPAGVGVGGDVNFAGSAGQSGISNVGGLGGGGPMSGMQNSGTAGVAGVFPGGGASGAGTGSSQNAPFNGAAGAGGLVVVRW